MYESSCDISSIIIIAKLLIIHVNEKNIFNIIQWTLKQKVLVIGLRKPNNLFILIHKNPTKNKNYLKFINKWLSSIIWSCNENEIKKCKKKYMLMGKNGEMLQIK